MTNQTKNKSFIIHKDSLSVLNKLTDEQAGKLFKAISAYQENKTLPNDNLISIIFEPFLNQFLRDEEKYKNVVERNKINIAKRWNKTNTKNTSGKSRIPKDTKNTDSDSKSDSDSKNKNDISKEIIPLFIDQKLLADFVEMRNKIKKPLTERAYELVIKQLTVFESNNTGSANVALQNSIMNCWQGVFEPKSLRSQSPPLFPTKQQQKDEQDKIIYSNLLKKYGKQDDTNF